MHKNAYPLADESVDVFSWLEIVLISIESSLFTDNESAHGSGNGFPTDINPFITLTSQWAR